MNGTALESGWKSTYTTRFQSTGYYFTNLSAEAAAKAAEEYYSSVSFDVSKYSSFSAIVGNLKETHRNANSTLRVYLDGTLAPEYTHKIVGGTSFELKVDLKGVSRMTIQLDPKNDGTPGDVGDWANGDIVCFGDAKFYQPDTEALIGELTPLWATSYPNYRGHDGKNESASWSIRAGISRRTSAKKRSCRASQPMAARSSSPTASPCTALRPMP